MSEYKTYPPQASLNFSQRLVKTQIKNKINFDLSMDKIMKPERGVREESYHSSSQDLNSKYCGSANVQEMLRQERIINAIIDNDKSDWHSTIQSAKHIKRRNYSTFDGRTNINIPHSLKKHDRDHLLQTQYF